MLLTYEEDGYIWAGSDRPFKTPYEAELDFLTYSQEELALFHSVCAKLPSADDYTRTFADRYGWNETLLQSACTFTVSELPLPARYFPRFWWCFENSFRYAEETGLLYVEGIVVTPTGVYIHAWNSHGEDVLDYTYPAQHLNSYFGIIFELTQLKQHWPAPGGVLGYLYEEVKKGKPGNAHRLLYG